MAPALWGPTTNSPKRSTWASVPPPALTVLMSIMGRATSRPSTLPRLEMEGSPSLMSATSQEVPPMSKVMRFCTPVVRQAWTLAVMPPAGPESTVATAFFAVASKVAMPPLDCMMYFCGVVTPAPFRRASRLSI